MKKISVKNNNNKKIFKNVYEAICSQKLYFKRTDGGAEYLCTGKIENFPVGDIRTAIIRLDGGAELLK